MWTCRCGQPSAHMSAPAGQILQVHNRFTPAVSHSPTSSPPMTSLQLCASDRPQSRSTDQEVHRYPAVPQPPSPCRTISGSVAQM